MRRIPLIGGTINTIMPAAWDLPSFELAKKELLVGPNVRLTGLLYFNSFSS
jgi:hypothetical protein